MKSSIDVVVVVTVGPTCTTEFILDTLSSVQYYIRSSHKIIIADDAQNQISGNKSRHTFRTMFGPSVVGRTSQP